MSTETRVRIGSLNCWDPLLPDTPTKLTKKRLAGMVDTVQRMRADVLCLQECRPEDLRDALRAARPGTHKIAVNGAQSVMFDAGRFEMTARVDGVFIGYHGFQAIRLRDLTTRREFGVCSVHVKPSSQATAEQQEAYLRRAITATNQLAPKLPTFVAGDLNSRLAASWVVLDGWLDARQAATASSTRTTPTHGTKVLDYVLARGATCRGFNVLDTGGGSDHRGLITAYTLEG